MYILDDWEIFTGDSQSEEPDGDEARFIGCSIITSTDAIEPNLDEPRDATEPDRCFNTGL